MAAIRPLRIGRTQEILQSVSPGQIDGTEEKPISIRTPRGELRFRGQDYVQMFVLPNVYFHCTTAYNILRRNGVEVGKLDFLGAV